MLSSKSSSPLWIELVLIALNEVETKRRREGSWQKEEEKLSASQTQ